MALDAPKLEPDVSRPCGCRQAHQLRRIVLTGGPGAGKTAVLELLRHALCEHVAILPEAAGILFGGGFPRRGDASSRRAAQRAIYHIQRELEEAAAGSGTPIQLCDRGAPDGSAYWIGDGTLWDAVRADRAAVLARYDAVVHLRVPSAANGYGHQNPLRIESASEAQAIDARILAAWEGHPRRTIIEASADFLEKSRLALAAIRRALPTCCQDHVDAAEPAAPAALQRVESR
jgi:predicted ATPase